MRTLEAILAEITPTPASYLKAARAITGGVHDELQPLKVGLLSTFTSEFLRPYLTVAGARRGFAVESWFGPWGQVEAQALDAASELYKQQQDVVVLLLRLEDLLPAITTRFGGAAAEKDAALDELRTRIGALLQGVRRQSARPIFVANFTPPIRLSSGLADATSDHSQTAWISKCNELLAETCRLVPDAYVFDLARVAVEHGLQAWTDPKLFYLARVPWSVSAQIAVAHSLVRTLNAALRPPAKVLILDLDNTLWGGVLGEEGIGGIAIGDEYPGNVFKAFQQYLLSLKDRGVLLAVATKNNPADVQEIWQKHRDCVLKAEDFAAIRIGWQEKSASIREIAQELNVGLDSCVFFDDSPFERAEVHRALPAVTVLDVPESALGFIDCVEGSGLFDRLIISAEDKQRGTFYQEQAARTEARASAGTPEEFLQSLELVATIGQVDDETLPRVAQLLAKTNQFNLTTRRHSAGAISEMLAAGGVGLWLRLADRFGDNGLVGVALAVPDSSEGWRIDTFLLSCRVIGRQAESSFLAEVAASVAKRGATSLVGEYVATPKNSLVADFYSRHGFGAAGDGVWTCDPRQLPFAAPYFIKTIRV